MYIHLFNSLFIGILKQPLTLAQVVPELAVEARLASKFQIVLLSAGYEPMKPV